MKQKMKRKVTLQSEKHCHGLHPVFFHQSTLVLLNHEHDLSITLANLVVELGMVMSGSQSVWQTETEVSREIRYRYSRLPEDESHWFCSSFDFSWCAISKSLFNDLVKYLNIMTWQKTSWFPDYEHHCLWWSPFFDVSSTTIIETKFNIVECFCFLKKKK